MFQARTTKFEWDVSLPYETQTNRLREEGPSELLFPDHFYQCEGGVVIIYWEKDRDCACIGTIVSVQEVEMIFFQIVWVEGQVETNLDRYGKRFFG